MGMTKSRVGWSCLGLVVEGLADAEAAVLADGEPSRGGVVRWKWRQRRWQMGSPAATSSRLGQRAWHAAQLAWPTETVPQ